METFPMDDAATFQIRGIRPGAWIISSWKTRASEYLGRAAALPLDRVELLEGIPKFVSDELKQSRHDK
jgi:hypothetical protein